MKKIIMLIFATATAKLIPLIAGWLVANKLGANNYALFVSFLLFSNMITSFSILGCSPQVIAIDSKRGKRSSQFEYIKIIVVGGFLLLCSILLLLLFYSKFYETHFSLFYSFLYSLGLFFIYLGAARFNSLGDNKSAGIVWLTYSFIIIIIMALWALAGSDLDGLIKYIAISACLVGGVTVYKTLSRGDVRGFCRLSLDSLFIHLSAAIKLSIFGFFLMGGFYLSQQYLIKNDYPNAPYFSILYQVFTFIVFIPSVLGNVVVPRLISNKVKSACSFYFFYVFIGLCILIATLMFKEYLFNFYKLDVYKIDNLTWIFFTITVLVATLNTYSTQLFVSKKMYGILSFSSMIWCLSLGTFFLIYKVALSNIFIAFAVSYSLNSIFLMYFILKKKMLVLNYG